MLIFFAQTTKISQEIQQSLHFHQQDFKSFACNEHEGSDHMNLIFGTNVFMS